MAASGAAAPSGTTCELPPPPVKGTWAVGPITAIERAAAPVSGRVPCSLRRSTAPAVATLRATRAPAAASRGGRAGCRAPSSPKRSMVVRIRCTAWSTAASGTEPPRTASRSGSPKWVPPGISMSRPARMAATVLWAAPQSETTQPSNPQPPRSSSSSSGLLSHAWTPLTLL